MLGSLLAVAVFLHDVRPASPFADELSGISMRGPGAMIRSHVDRVATLLDEGRATEALVAADALLADLRLRVDAPDDPLDGATLADVAQEVVAIRNRAVAWLVPFPAGFRGAFLATVVDGATFSDWRQGVPASITLAQAILESDWGRSAPGHNLFGLKGEGPAGSTVRRVVEYRGGKRRHRMASFRAYADAAGSLADHAAILARSRRYARARAAGDDVDAFARALQGTYATDPRYAQKLARLVASFDLGRFDWRAGPPVP